MLNNNQKELKNQRKINPKRLELMIKKKTKKRKTKKRKIRMNQKIIRLQLLQLPLLLLLTQENITH